MILMAVRLLAEGPPDPSPSSVGLPIAGLSLVFGWLKYIALAICAASGIIGGGTMAYANNTARPDLAMRAKVGMLWAMGGAFVIAIAVRLVMAVYGIA